VLLAARTDEGALLHARDIARVASGEEAPRPLLGVEPDERPRLDELFAEAVVLLIRPVAPVDVGGCAEFGHLLHPFDELGMRDPVRCAHASSMPRDPGVHQALDWTVGHVT